MGCGDEVSESTELTTELAPSDFAPIELRPLPDDAPEWAHVLNGNLYSVAQQGNSTNRAIASTLDLVAQVKEQVGPLLESLTNSPMLGMLIGRKKP